MLNKHKYEYSIMTCCRWEYNNISEWVSYYKSIGFDHIYLYCNDDDPRDLYSNCLPFMSNENSFITFVHYAEVGNQFGMILDFLKRFKHETKWISFLDCDEFLLLRNINNIKKFMENFQQNDAVYFNWSMFGTNSFEKRPEGSVLLNYFYRENILHPLTKVVSKTEIYSEEWIKTNEECIDTDPDDSIHHGISSYLTDFNCVNVLGENMNQFIKSPIEHHMQYLLGASNKIREVAVLNHYFIKSTEDFIRRWKRSATSSFSRQKIWKEAFEKGDYKNIIKNSIVKDTYLRDLWRGVTKKAFDINVGAREVCISVGKPCTQSSISEWSHGSSVEEDASFVVQENFPETYGNHTDFEENPWWIVDLETIKEIRKIVIYNRKDAASDRIKCLSISFSNFGDIWRGKISLNDINLGADKYISIDLSNNNIDARFVKIEVEGENYLHFRKVEIY